MDLFVREGVGELWVKKKGGGEPGNGPRIDELNAYIDAQLAKYAKLARTTPKAEFTMDDLDEVFYSLVTTG